MEGVDPQWGSNEATVRGHGHGSPHDASHGYGPQGMRCTASFSPILREHVPSSAFIYYTKQPCLPYLRCTSLGLSTGPQNTHTHTHTHTHTSTHHTFLRVHRPLYGHTHMQTDASFRQWAELYARDEKLFFKDFAAAFSKLIALGMREQHLLPRDIVHFDTMSPYDIHTKVCECMRSILKDHFRFSCFLQGARRPQCQQGRPPLRQSCAARTPSSVSRRCTDPWPR